MATSTGGRIAAGGDAQVESCSVACALPSSQGSEDVLVAGGAVVLRSSTVCSGNVVFGTTGVVETSSLPGGTIRQDAPIDFATASQELLALTDALAQLPSNGTVDVPPWGTIGLTGTDPELNVFTVPAATLDSATSLTLSVPVGSTALVNVPGPSATVQNMGFSLEGATASTLLLNFPEATSLVIQSTGAQGTFLAPRASVSFNSASFAGTLVAGTLQGNGAAQDARFSGCLPISSEPEDTEPPTLALVAPTEPRIVPVARPLIEASFTDFGSGVDPATVQLSLDGVDRTAQATVTSEGFELTPTEDLSDGLHGITVSVRDLAGNLAQASWTLTVDTVAPFLSIDEPSETDILTTLPTIPIAVRFGDATSGVDLATLSILLDDQPLADS